MPGLAGIVTRMPRKEAMQQLDRMIRSMLHEPFYVSGTWADEVLGLYIGWVERDVARPLPLHGEDSRLLFFSGEEFSGQIAGEMAPRSGDDTHAGRAFSTGARVSDFLARLNGQFQGVLVNTHDSTCVLFNDRYALRRVYCHEGADAFYFAAEAKAILAARPELREADPQGIGEHLACGCVLGNRTLFKRIALLPPASAWSFRAGRLESKGEYFCRRSWEEQEVLQPEAYFEAVQEAFTRALPRCFYSDKGIGLSLTGGLDTRMILAGLERRPQSLPCYTFGGTNRDSRDVRIARHVAKICEQPHQVIVLEPDFLSGFGRYAEQAVFVSDGSAGTQHAPDLYINRAARQIAPIRMTGNYGDQVLRQMTMFRPGSMNAGVFTPELIALMHRGAETYKAAVQGHALTRASMHQTAWFYYGILSVELSQVEMRTPYLDNDLVGTLYRAPESVLHDNDLRVRLIHNADPVLARIRTDLGFAGGGGRLASLTSQQLHRFTMRMEYACEHASPRWLANLDRSLLRGQLERTFMGRHKFTHFSLWFRGPLAEYVRETLLEARTLSRWYVDRGQLEGAVRRHMSGEENLTPTIHKLLSLEYFHRLFVDAA